MPIDLSVQQNSLMQLSQSRGAEIDQSLQHYPRQPKKKEIIEAGRRRVGPSHVGTSLRIELVQSLLRHARQPNEEELIGARRLGKGPGRVGTILRIALTQSLLYLPCQRHE